MSIHQQNEPTDCIGPEAQDHLDRIAKALGYNDASYEMADHCKQLVQDSRDLAEIKREVVEYVHDGGDFDWTLAVIEIRAWRAQIGVLNESFQALRKCLLSTKRVEAEFKLTDAQMMHMRRIIRNALAIGDDDGEQAAGVSADTEVTPERQAKPELQPDTQACDPTPTAPSPETVLDTVRGALGLPNAHSIELICKIAQLYEIENGLRHLIAESEARTSVAVGLHKLKGVVDGILPMTAEQRRFMTLGMANMEVHTLIGTLRKALENVLAWMTNANAVPTHEMVAGVFTALAAAGVSKEDLDAAAIATLRGAARRPMLDDHGVRQMLSHHGVNYE